MENGYELIKLTKGYLFKEGKNTFLQLISQLNSMKIEAQLNKQPTIRNLAKLLMNSMYGRFGMHPSLQENHIYTEEQVLALNPFWDLLTRFNYGDFITNI
jgi:hypothetical protein